MRILLSLLTLLMTFSLFAADEKKDTAVVLKGEHTDGAGYRVYFSDDKKTFLNLSGYARLMTSFSADDKPTGDDGKFTMPYFRLLLDGQSDKNWSWHTRVDYRDNMFMSKGTKTDDAEGKTYGAPGLYFARAYLTYRANDMFSVDFGRISNLIYKFDVMSKTDVKVGFGVMPKFNYKDFSLVGTINYSNDAQRTGPTVDRSADGVLVNQLVTIGTRAGYNYKVNKDYAINFGMMVNGDTQHSQEKTIQLMPDFMLTGPSDFYVLNQALKKTFSRHKSNIYENYTEVGFTLNNFWSPDINYTLTKENAAAETKHTIAAELLLKHSAAITTFYTFIYDDYLAKLKTDKSKTVKAWIQYDF